jgi:hypothetical protein
MPVTNLIRGAIWWLAARSTGDQDLNLTQRPKHGLRAVPGRKVRQTIGPHLMQHHTLTTWNQPRTTLVAQNRQRTTPEASTQSKFTRDVKRMVGGTSGYLSPATKDKNQMRGSAEPP